jgi:low affinity Fe/Cu permease
MSPWLQAKGGATLAENPMKDLLQLRQPQKGTDPMLMTIAIVLILLYALGLVTSYTMGGLIHILLVTAIVIVLVRVIQGRQVL